MVSRGVYTALITPLDEFGTLQESVLTWLVQRSVHGKVAGVVFAGTTGEEAFLHPRVREQDLMTVLDAVRGRIPVLCGVEKSRWQETVDAVRHAKAMGVDASIVAPPSYERLRDDEIEGFYASLAEHLDAPDCAL